MKNMWTSLIVIAFFSHCAIDRTITPLNHSEVKSLENCTRFNPQHYIEASKENEPGRKLKLCLTFVSKETKKPLRHQKIKLYHATSKGEYEPSDPNDESTARLNGSAYTNDKGQLFVKTVLPGDYGSSSDNRHIHTTVENAKPEAYDIHFKQYTGHMSHNFISGSDQHFLADLKQTKDGSLVAFLTIEVKKPQIQSTKTH